jgi:hypothetical protein
MWLSLLGNKYIIIGLLLALSLGGGTIYIKILKGNISNLTAENKSLSLELDVAQNSVKLLQTSIDEQNSAIQVLKSDADKRQEAHKAEILAARNTATNLKAQAAAIMAIKIPSDANSCNAANELINLEIQNAK